MAHQICEHNSVRGDLGARECGLRANVAARRAVSQLPGKELPERDAFFDNAKALTVGCKLARRGI